MSETQALHNLWTELGRRVRGYVGKRVTDVHAADDVAQDVMLKIQSQLHALPAGDKLAPWVFRVTRNAVIDYYRARSTTARVATTDVDRLADDAAEERDALRELTPCLLMMMRQLPEPYREAMRLADFEGLDQQEVALRLGISHSGAKSRVQRARRQLREMILDCCNVVRDGRGGVADYETTERTARYCGDGRADEGCSGG